MCDRCGSPACGNCNPHSTKGLPSSSFNNPHTNDFKYMCPECGFQFNRPLNNAGCSTVVEYRCPSCGRKMEGM